jgi:Tol biopolymer transport system component
MRVRPFTLRRTATLLSIVLAVGVADPPPADSQYFGRNKVQYRTFDFQVLRTPHFDIHYYPEMELAARDAGRMAERWYSRLSGILGHEFEERQPVILYATHPDFQQTLTTGHVSDGVGGFVEAFKQRLVMPFTGSYQEFDRILGHEMVHAFQYDISGLGRAGGGLEAAARRFNVPLWFMEGMAEYLALGAVDPNTAMHLRDGALTGDIPSIAQLSDPRVFPYRYGHALWAYVAGRWGDAIVGQILRQVGSGVPYPEAFYRLTNSTLEEISEDWHASIRRTYLPLRGDRAEPREIARPLMTRQEGGGRVNLGPAISPDGRYMAFVSERSRIDYEIWLADTETGEVIRRLVKGVNLDPHYSSLRFIGSTGSFSSDGTRFVFVAQSGERDVLVLLDVERARVIREIQVPEIREMANPAWSPDGQTLVFSGIVGGLSNLHAIDLESGETRQLTNDWYAALLPTFSPDGGTIAFTTDRGPDTDAATLRWGSYRVALLDLATLEVRDLPGMVGDNVDPAWAQDGQSLFFRSNRSGISNIYRIELASGRIHRVTDLFAGVSGITPLSPAIATARSGHRLLFTALERGGYNIYSITGPERLAGTTQASRGAPEAEPGEKATPDPAVDPPLPAVLPPAPRPDEPAFTRVEAALSDWTTGLPSREEALAWTVAPYRPRLTLDYLGQPQIGFASGGAFQRGGLYGGIFGIWSDMLGRHTAMGAIQAQGQLDEIGFATLYLYRRNRWNYGASAHRIPYFMLGQRLDVVEFGGQPVGRYELVRLRFFDWNLAGIAQYPFSSVQRLELTAGLRRIAQDEQAIGYYFDLDGSRTSDWYQEDRPGESFNFAEASAALVYDNTLVGPTSPIAGQRYRLEVSPMAGGLQLVQTLADIRRYLMVRPFTLAARGLHFGRYGRDAESLFQQIYIGHPYFLRGYDYSQVREDCRLDVTVQPGECPLRDHLIGSRVAVLNAELRFPLIRALVLGLGPIGLPPIEGYAFYDAATAWGSGSEPVFERGTPDTPAQRGFITSSGVGGRVNLLGYLILQIDYVNPHQRQRGWHWQFSIQPGF